MWLLSFTIAVLKATAWEPGRCSRSLRAIFQDDILLSVWEIFDHILSAPVNTYHQLNNDYNDALLPGFRRLHESTAIFVDNIDEYYEGILREMNAGRERPVGGRVKRSFWHLAQYGIAAAGRFGEMPPPPSLPKPAQAMTSIPCPIPPDPSRVSKVVMLAALAALASLGACSCPVGEPPEVSTAADAQVKDAAYCAELGRLALRYTGHAGGNGGLAPDYTTLDAIDDCSKGNTARGILILEKKLRCSGFTLPKR